MLIVKTAQQDASLHQGEVHFANQINSQLQGGKDIDQMAAMAMIESESTRFYMVSELQGLAMASTKANNQSTHTSPELVNNQSTHTNSNSSNTLAAITPKPYFLNSSENLGNILVTQPLLGMRNYQSWSRAMVLALTAKKKIGFVNGKVTKPDLNSPLYEDWESCNTMVLSWMINSMHVDVSSNIMYCETARGMWIELQNVFSQGNGPKIYNLQTEISQIRQNQMFVIEFYIKFK
ncbi:uncharacterized protein LOC126704088 [Quercus robur]|uniref:uncharacterized protein LOC126704088 n=1 Tax=Quercus robur TaxID=38942 RepID=UPI0021625260|nr:uncharacterized protein LOC126704088 [Quercus robur]